MLHPEEIPPSRTSPEMREYCKRPGTVDDQGNIVYFTEQHHKKECDVNFIIAKYDKEGIIKHVSRFEAKFGDMTGVDFKEMQDTVAKAKTSFNNLPANLRKRFGNSPEGLLSFMENPANRQEAIKLGIIRSDWTEATDGIGEHVKEGENKINSDEQQI